MRGTLNGRSWMYDIERGIVVHDGHGTFALADAPARIQASVGRVLAQMAADAAAWRARIAPEPPADMNAEILAILAM